MKPILKEIIKEIDDFLKEKMIISYKHNGSHRVINDGASYLISFEVSTQSRADKINLFSWFQQSDEQDLKHPGYEINIQAEQVKNNEFYNIPELRKQIDSDINELQSYLNKP